MKYRPNRSTCSKQTPPETSSLRSVSAGFIWLLFSSTENLYRRTQCLRLYVMEQSYRWNLVLLCRYFFLFSSFFHFDFPVLRHSFHCRSLESSVFQQAFQVCSSHLPSITPSAADPEVHLSPNRGNSFSRFIRHASNCQGKLNLDPHADLSRVFSLSGTRASPITAWNLLNLQTRAAPQRESGEKPKPQPGRIYFSFGEENTNCHD